MLRRFDYGIEIRTACGCTTCGKPFRIAIKLRVVRDGQLFVGDAALVLEPRPEGTTDPTTGAPLPADISGLGHLLRELTKLFMIHDDDYNDLTLDSFFDHRRGSADLLTYLTDFVMKYEEAESRAGLTINNIRKNAFVVQMVCIT